MRRSTRYLPPQAPSAAHRQEGRTPGRGFMHKTESVERGGGAGMTSSKPTLVTPKSGSTWLAMNRQTRPPACTANPCPVPTCCTLCWQRRPKQRVHFVCAARSRQADHDHAQHALPDHVQRPEYFSTPRSNLPTRRRRSRHMTSSKPTLVTPKSGSTWQAMNRQKRVGEMLSQLPNAAKRHTLPSSSSS